MIARTSSAPRADHLATPPLVGRYYMVPAILWPVRAAVGWLIGHTQAETLALWQAHRDAQWWPVWGRKHADKAFFDFTNLHYHIDPRFLSVRQWRLFSVLNPLADVQRRPINGDPFPDGPPAPTLRRMRCSRADVQWQKPGSKPTRALNSAFDGRQCARSERGWICPHQRFPVGATPAIDGIVTCPLHGMRIHGETGICAGAAQ